MYARTHKVHAMSNEHLCACTIVKLINSLLVRNVMKSNLFVAVNEAHPNKRFTDADRHAAVDCNQ